jgi:hypothetical protein
MRRSLQTQIRIEQRKRLLGLSHYRLLGTLEAKLPADRTLLLCFRSGDSAGEPAPVWEARVEIVAGRLHLQMWGVATDAHTTLFYIRAGSYSVARHGQNAEFVASAGLEFLLIAADGPLRSAVTSRTGQVIFPLVPGVFALLLPPDTGWEIRIVWLPDADAKLTPG